MASLSILMLGVGSTISLTAAINFITALIAVLPNAVIGIISEVTGHLQKVILNARVCCTGIQTDAGTDVWTSLRNPIHEAGETVLSARPFGD